MARQRARQGTGTVYERGDRFMAQLDLGRDSNGRRQHRTRSFETRQEAEERLLDQRTRRSELEGDIADQQLADFDPLRRIRKYPQVDAE